MRCPWTLSLLTCYTQKKGGQNSVHKKLKYKAESRAACTKAGSCHFEGWCSTKENKHVQITDMPGSTHNLEVHSANMFTYHHGGAKSSWHVPYEYTA